MNIASWIMASGALFGIGLFLMTAFSIDPWEDHSYENVPPIAAGAPSPHGDDRSKMVCSTCHEIISSNVKPQISRIPPIVGGAPAPHRDGRERQPCAECHRILSQQEAMMLAGPGGFRQNSSPAAPAATPARTVPVAQVMVPSLPPRQPTVVDPEWHERFRPVRFQGKVVQIIGRSTRSGRRNVSVRVSDSVNAPVWYNLAPSWYLKSKKCNVGLGMFVKGTAFKEMGRKNPKLMYGKSIAVNGQFCLLRDKEMRGAWESGGHHGAGHVDEE
ncbi:MAG: magnetochrome domain-containing protein [Magnetococcales bacterium]|nr:magnetochrome domain-containing protein [Magnetococcales bacterium]